MRLYAFSGMLTVAAAFAAGFLTPGYSFSQNYLSDIGTGKYGALFNASVISAAFLFLMFFLKLRSSMKKSLLSEAAAWLAVLSCVALAGIGIITKNYPLHSAVAYLFFSLSLLAVLLFSFMTKSFAARLAAGISMLLTLVFGYFFITGSAPLAPLLQKFVVLSYILSLFSIIHYADKNW